MECTKIETCLEDYLQGTLLADDAERVETHLSRCPSCRETAAELQALEAWLDKASEWKVPVPPYLAQSIMANLPARTSTGWLSWRFLKPLAAAASLILAVGLGFLARDLLPRTEAVQEARAQSVRIIFYSPEAESVALIGDFNDWGQREVSLAQSSDRGIWEFSLSLRPGVYHYNLLVDGERWVANPKSSTLVPDGFGGYNSVLVVSEKCQDDCT